MEYDNKLETPGSSLNLAFHIQATMEQHQNVKIDVQTAPKRISNKLLNFA